MKKTMSNRVKRLELKCSRGSSLERYLVAIDGLSRGLPSAPAPISPERQAEIDNAFAQLSEEVLTKLSDIGCR